MPERTKLQPLVEMDAEDFSASRSSRKTRGGGDGFRDSMNSGGGKILLAVVAIAAVAFSAWRLMPKREKDEGPSPQIRIMNKAGELRWLTVKMGGSEMPAGFYSVEWCFDNECGPAGGTPVIMNGKIGKDGPTLCPRCGSRTSHHNRRPDEYLDTKPHPTETFPIED